MPGFHACSAACRCRTLAVWLAGVGALALSGCTVVAVGTAAVGVATTAVGVATTAVGVAADVAIGGTKLVGKGVGAAYGALTEEGAPAIPTEHSDTLTPAAPGQLALTP